MTEVEGQCSATEDQARFWSDFLKRDISYLSREVSPYPAVTGGGFFEPLFSANRQRVESFAGGRVLEIGCGDGMDAIALAKRYGCRVVATDLAPARVRLARDNVRRYGVEGQVDVVSADVHSLPFGDGSFDGAIANSVMLFVDHDRACSEVARVLAKGASFVLTNESMPLSPLVRLSRRIGLGYRSRELERHVRRRLDPERIEELGRRYFTSVDYSVHFGPLLQLRWGVHLLAERARDAFGQADHYFKKDAPTPRWMHRADEWCCRRSARYRARTWIASVRFVR